MITYFYNILNNMTNLILLLIALPVVAGILVWLCRKVHVLQCILTFAAAALNLILAFSLWQSDGVELSSTFAGYGLDLHFAADQLSCAFLMLAAFSFFFVAFYCLFYLKSKPKGGLFLLLYFISLAMINGALLSQNLGMLLFFWEGLLCTLFVMLLINNLHQPKTALKALTISGAADLILMLGIIITAFIYGKSDIHAGLPATGLAALGCVCMLLGAMGKAGVMPFHSWIPNAASDATTPFLVAFPGSMEKIAGIYLTARIVTDIYPMQHGDGMSTFVCIIGAVTLFFGVSMALIQKDMKRLLAYHAISQVGYMILGIGTGLAVGLAGGVFHMINNVLYKSALFMIAGILEYRLGTTDLHFFGGVGRKMPVTMICFLICGLSIAGFPGFNGFFSKELIFDAALETSIVYYIIALVGAFMTAASFLKLGGAAFFGKERLPQGVKSVREANAGMLIPVIVLSALCILFGICNDWPLTHLVQIPFGLESAFSGWPASPVLVILSCLILLIAVLNHIFGIHHNKKGALGALDHIHYAPGLKTVYALAEAGKLDPYNWFTGIVNGFAFVCQKIEDGVSWLYDKGVPCLIRGAGNALHRFNNGRLNRYLVIAVVGVACIAILFLAVLL